MGKTDSGRGPAPECAGSSRNVVAPEAKPIMCFTTAELLDELAMREGVRLSRAAEGASVSAWADGPATVVVVDGGEHAAEGR